MPYNAELTCMHTALTCKRVLAGTKPSLSQCSSSNSSIPTVGQAAPPVSTNHRLHRGAGDHELHLLSQHGGRCLLLDQVISPVDLQLGLQVSRRVEVFAVLSRAAALKQKHR